LFLFEGNLQMMDENGRFTRRTLLGSTAAILATRSACAVAGKGLARPNIIFIMADDLGYADLSCYGRREYQTPNIDKLAAQGVLLKQAYSNSPVCSATRTALITGRYQYRLPIGLEEPLAQRDVGLPPSHPTLPSLLKKAGYRTALIGKWHLGSLPNYGPLQSGYDHFWGFRSGGVDYFSHKSPVGPDLWDGDHQVSETGYLTDILGDRAISMVRDSSKRASPFFLSLHFSAPHWPWEGPNDQQESIRLSKKTDFMAMMDFDGGSMKTYAAMVTRMDYQVGRLMAELKTQGIEKNTIIIFTSDNGGERFSNTWPFSGKKTELLEGGVRIPAIVRWPGHVPAGSACQQVNISMDWLPTLLTAAGVKPDPLYPLDGLNLLPQLFGGLPFDRTLFWRYMNFNQKSCRSGDWKYLKIRDNEFLFNIVEDPQERANLDKREPIVFKKMQDEYVAWVATMLPIDNKAFTHGFTSSDMADHLGVTKSRMIDD
jgi:arylsulfatase A-like enzyme